MAEGTCGSRTPRCTCPIAGVADGRRNDDDRKMLRHLSFCEGTTEEKVAPLDMSENSPSSSAAEYLVAVPVDVVVIAINRVNQRQMRVCWWRTKSFARRRRWRSGRTRTLGRYRYYRTMCYPTT
jgi:hypothetical protein